MGAPPTYDELVAAGRAVVRERDGTNWKAGDLALRVESLSESDRAAMATHGGESPLQRYAKDIGANHSSLRSWRDTSVAWPLDRRRSSSRSWSTHRVLNAQPDRFELIESVATRAEAEKIVRERDRPAGGPEVLPSTFGDRLVYALGRLDGETTSFENLMRANDGRKFRDRHIEMFRRSALIAHAKADLLDELASGAHEAINAQAFIEALNRPWTRDGLA